jgi:hypothetical protein
MVDEKWKILIVNNRITLEILLDIRKWLDEMTDELIKEELDADTAADTPQE